MLSVTLYTKPACVQCEQTQKLLAKDVPNAVVKMVDVTIDEQARQYVMDDLGYLGAPVVQWEADGVVGGHWAGFRPDHIRSLKTYDGQENVASSADGKLVGSNA